MMNSFFFHRLAESLGWTLLHSLWQGLVIVVLLSLVLGLGRRMRSQVRYGISLVSLMLMLVWTATTFVGQWKQTAQSSEGVSILTAAGDVASWISIEVVHASTFPAVDSWLETVDPYVPLLSLLWIMGVVIFGIRWMGSWMYLNRLKTREVYTLEYFWQTRLQRIAEKMGIRQHIVLLESSLIDSPMVVGHWKPVVLLPLGLLSGISPVQLEAILAHELAHIQRYDFLLNMLQSWVEILFFYHPAYWWLSAKIQDEREHCCDDRAVAICGDPLIYAEALTEVEACRVLHKNSLAMALSGRKNHLLYRIKRLVMPQTAVKHSKSKVFCTALLLLGLLGISWLAPRHLQADDISPLSSPEPGFYYSDTPNVSELAAVLESRIDTPPPAVKPPLPPTPPMDASNVRTIPKLVVPPVPALPPLPPNFKSDSIEEQALQQFKLDIEQFQLDQQNWQKDLESSIRAFEEGIQAFEEFQKVKEDQLRESLQLQNVLSQQQQIADVQAESMGFAEAIKRYKEAMMLQEVTMNKLKELKLKKMDKALQLQERTRELELSRRLKELQQIELDKHLQLQEKHKLERQLQLERQLDLSKELQLEKKEKEQIRALKMEMEMLEKEQLRSLKINMDRLMLELKQKGLENSVKEKLRRQLQEMERELRMQQLRERTQRLRTLEQAQLAQDKALALEKLYKERSGDRKKVLLKELKKDKLIGNNPKKIKIKITEDEFKINGKKLSKEKEEKYRKIFKSFGIIMQGTSRGNFDFHFDFD